MHKHTNNMHTDISTYTTQGSTYTDKLYVCILCLYSKVCTKVRTYVSTYVTVRMHYTFDMSSPK